LCQNTTGKSTASSAYLSSTTALADAHRSVAELNAIFAPDLAVVWSNFFNGGKSTASSAYPSSTTAFADAHLSVAELNAIFAPDLAVVWSKFFNGGFHLGSPEFSGQVLQSLVYVGRGCLLASDRYASSFLFLVSSFLVSSLLSFLVS